VCVCVCVRVCIHGYICMYVYNTSTECLQQGRESAWRSITPLDVSSYATRCVLILLHVSSSCSTFALILLHMCPHTGKREMEHLSFRKPHSVHNFHLQPLRVRPFRVLQQVLALCKRRVRGVHEAVAHVAASPDPHAYMRARTSRSQKVLVREQSGGEMWKKAIAAT
jgi:hypothetical protein